MRIKYKAESFRELFINIFGRILEFSGYMVNDDWIIQSKNTNLAIRLNQMYLYIVESGFEAFNLKNSRKLLTFNPFKNYEHIMAIVKLVAHALDGIYRDEDDPIEFSDDGVPLDIVTMIKRRPVTEDMVPKNFAGHIYEFKLRNGTPDEIVLGRGLDEDDDAINSIIMALLETVNNELPTNQRINYNYKTLFNSIRRYLKIFSDEYKVASDNFTNKVHDVEIVNINDAIEDDGQHNPVINTIDNGVHNTIQNNTQTEWYESIPKNPDYSGDIFDDFIG